MCLTHTAHKDMCAVVSVKRRRQEGGDGKEEIVTKGGMGATGECLLFDQSGETRVGPVMKS